jgi:hypothetical protein
LRYVEVIGTKTGEFTVVYTYFIATMCFKLSVRKLKKAANDKTTAAPQQVQGGGFVAQFSQVLQLVG